MIKKIFCLILVLSILLNFPSFIFANELPSSYINDTSMLKVKDQGTIGACLTYSWSYAIEWWLYKKIGTYHPMSPLEVYVHRNYLHSKGISGKNLEVVNHLIYGDGMPERMIYNYENIDVPEAYELWKNRLYDYNMYANDQHISKINSFHNINTYIKSYETIRSSDSDYVNKVKQQLYNNKVIVGLFYIDDIYLLSATGKDGIIKDYPGYKIGHEMLITGWDDNKQSWRILNSWGSYWADEGYAWWGYDNIKPDELYCITNIDVPDIYENRSWKVMYSVGDSWRDLEIQKNRKETEGYKTYGTRIYKDNFQLVLGSFSNQIEAVAFKDKLRIKYPFEMIQVAYH